MPKIAQSSDNRIVLAGAMTTHRRESVERALPPSGRVVKTATMVRIPCTAALWLGPALILVSGCAGRADDRFPSLAKRPIEAMDLTRIPDPVEPPPLAPADGALAGKIAEYRAQANQGQSRFGAELAGTRARVNAARGSAPASDPWMEAQMAISGLEAARRPSVEALASLDQLRAERQERGERAGEEALVEAANAVRAMIARQSETLTGFKQSLRMP